MLTESTTYRFTGLMIRPLLPRLLLSGALLCGPLFAQDSGQAPFPSQQPGQPGAQTTQPGASPEILGTDKNADPLEGDRRFIREALEQSTTEVELGKLAQEKASSASVKDMAAKLVDDHEKLNETLKSFATQANVPLTSDLPRKAKKSKEKLSKLSGEEFDQAYVAMLTKEHKNSVKSYERQAQDSRVPAVKELAEKALPVLKDHQEKAEQLNGTLNPGKK